MSYSKQYHETIKESVNYSYKDSDGHTHYGSKTINVPIDINIYVETNPFDNSVIKSVSSVDTLTGAVATMNAAQCTTVKANSDRISGKN